MVHWYGKWMTSISFWLRIWYHQKCSHSTSILTCRVCISPRAPLDNSDNHSIPCTYTGQPYYCVHELGGSQWSSLRMDVMWLWHELYPWRTMLLMRVVRHLSPEGCLSHWIQMCSWLRALVLSMVIIWLKCVVYVVACHPHKSGRPIHVPNYDTQGIGIHHIYCVCPITEPCVTPRAIRKGYTFIYVTDWYMPVGYECILTGAVS